MGGLDKAGWIHAIVKLLWHFCSQEIIESPSLNIQARKIPPKNPNINTEVANFLLTIKTLNYHSRNKEDLVSFTLTAGNKYILI